MQKSRRGFIKNAAIVTVSTAAIGSTVLAATTGKGTPDMGNGVNVGKSKKKEILYKKTAAWEEFYRQAL